jgi:two-component system, NarL family, nitrate/nitrite response regulator NarL
MNTFRYERSSNGFEGSRPSMASAAALPESRYAIHVQIVAPSLISWGLQRLVQSAGTSFRLVGASLTLADAMPLLEQYAADVVLLDLDDGYGPEHISELTGRLGAKVLALTCVGDRQFLDRVVAAGARGIFRKQEAPALLLKALESVAMGGRLVPPVPDPQVQASPRPAPSSSVPRTQEEDKLSLLTNKERRAVAAVVADASAPAKVIAERLFISEHTLRNHLTSIYSKLEVSGRLGLQVFISQQQQGILGRLC